MTKEMIMAMVEVLGKDVRVQVCEDAIYVVVQDFLGFDDDYCEVMADYDVDAVEAFCDALEEGCKDFECDLREVYYFDDFEVVVSYASADI